jgi:hypothetical protein
VEIRDVRSVIAAAMAHPLVNSLVTQEPPSNGDASAARITAQDWTTRERIGRTARTNAPDHSALHGRDDTSRTVLRRLKPF